jgi:hypothetical protein
MKTQELTIEEMIMNAARQSTAEFDRNRKDRTARMAALIGEIGMETATATAATEDNGDSTIEAILANAEKRRFGLSLGGRA